LIKSRGKRESDIAPPIITTITPEKISKALKEREIKVEKKRVFNNIVEYY